MSKLVYRTTISMEKLHDIDQVIRYYFNDLCKSDKVKLVFVIHEVIVNTLQAYEHNKVVCSDRMIEIRIDTLVDEVCIEVVDYAGVMRLDKDQMARHNQEGQHLEPNGRGMLFINQFVDEFSWYNHEEGGISVRIKKKTQKASEYEYEVI